MSNPSDLNIVPQPDTDKDYFNFKAAGLKIDKNYAIKFQWVYDDGTVSEWSPGYQVVTPTEQIPASPSVTVPSESTGNIPVTLSTFPANAKRVDIYVIGGSVYGTGKVVDSFLAAGTKTISITEPGVYQVQLIAVTPSGINGTPSQTFTITVVSPVPEEIVPATIISATASAGVNPLDSSGQLGYINLSITNGVIPAVFGGYIVKIQSSTNTWTQTFESKTALSSLYVNTGIIVGSSYTLSVATTNGKVTSEYIAVTGNPISVTDSRSNTSTVSGNLSFAATDSILTVSWSPSTDAQVDSYRVQITTNADTSFLTPLQSIFTKSTNTSFGGLDAGVTYRVRVTTRYGGSSGALSTSHTSGTVTLDASGAISDGIAPTTNPALTLSMVKSFFGAFSISFPAITNADAVTYEIFIKPTDATGIVSSTYKVLEVSGTFAVIRTLADKTTSLSYGTNYYIAIRAKDNDGVSTGTVTPVGPVQTTQVSTQDLADLGITEVKINTSAITEAKIAANAITETKIASDAVTSPKIVAGAISAGKIAAGAITTEKLDALAITADKIAANAITATKIAAGEIQAVAIAANAIVAGKIAADAIVANNIQSNQIDASKMVTDLLFASKTISVGESTSLNRIRLDGVPATVSGVAIKSRMFIGAGNYYDSGTPFFADNTGRFSIADKLKYDTVGGLVINGSGTFTGTLTAGSGLSTISIGNDVNLTNDGIYIGATGDYIFTDGRVRLGNGGITYTGGVLTVTGNVAATSLASDTTISGTIINGGTFQTSATVGNGSTAGIRINTSGIFGYTASSATPNFSVSNTGILTANAGNIGSWVINSGKLASSSGASPTIELDPLTPQIVIRGTGGQAGFSITLAPVTGITAGSTFSVTPSGILTSTSGSIGGWSVGSSSISRSTNYTGLFGSTYTRTTTLGSNAILQVATTEVATAFSYTDYIPAFLATNGSQRTTIGPGLLQLETTASQNGVPVSTLTITKPPGDYDTYIYWTGGNSANLRWVNYQGTERTARTISPTWDLVPQTLRPLVLDTEGRQALGATSYFSTTQTTTPSASTGLDGDLYYSTA
jgi:hypothetical protein